MLPARAAAMETGRGTNISAIRRLAILFVVSDFVEVVLVQLSYETGEVTVFEMLGQDSLGELLVLFTQRPN
jgi:hypothetical protein